MRPHHLTSNEDRSRIVGSYNVGEDLLALAHTLGINRTTAYGIIRTYQREERRLSISSFCFLRPTR